MLRPGPEGFIDRIPEPTGLPDWITQAEFDHYVAEFTRTGFTGGLNWYRNIDRNWYRTADAAAATDRVSEVISGPYHEVMIDGAGHWIQQERPDAVNAPLLDFLKEWS
jgi:pimeloyl-ACP methyl ester carboxylesterase